MLIAELVVSLDALDPTGLSRTEVNAALKSLAKVRSWADARHVVLTRRLKHIADTSPEVSPQADVAAASRSGRRDADRAVARVDALDSVPELETSLEAGGVSGAHVDVLANALSGLKPEDQEALAADADRLVAIAERCTPEEFAKVLRREVARLDARSGEERLIRQRSNTRLRYWFDRDTGMWHLRGEFDPETGLHLQGRIDNTVEALFHAAVPDTCPTGDAKHDHLRGLALAQLILGGRSDIDGDTNADTGRKIDVCVVIDLDTLLHGLHDHSLIDNGTTADLPIESYRRMACNAAIIPIVLNSDGVIVDMGREIRLANRAQRRALRAMYDTCAIPGCTVKSSHCQPHHIHWWRHGGPTDLHNLVPLCSRHHHHAHEGGWKLAIHPNRSLTITYPDHTTHTTGPPATQRAA